MQELCPECSCGWKGPAYPDNDEYTAREALRIHKEQSEPLAAEFYALLSVGPGRADPAHRLRTALPEPPSNWSWEEASSWSKSKMKSRPQPGGWSA